MSFHESGLNTDQKTIKTGKNSRYRVYLRYLRKLIWQRCHMHIRHEHITAWGTLLLAAATLAIAIVTCSTDATTRKALVAANRAWVGPYLAQTDKSPNNITDAMNVIVHFRNTGLEPGVKGGITFEFDSMDVTDPIAHIRDIQEEHARTCLAKKPPIEQSRIFYPSGESANYRTAERIDPKRIDWDVIYGKKYITIHGCVIYETFGEFRHSAFCYWFRAGITPINELPICDRGNAAD
jgi:hypothetical protein